VEGFQYGDIIVIGAIAAFIILRYRAMLGNQEGRDPAEVKRPKPLEEYERVVKIAERATPVVEQQTASQYPALLETSFKTIRALDAEFSPEEFLVGAKMAFEMVIKAFNESDHDTLKMLLAPDVYESFKEAIDMQIQQNVQHQTTLVSIEKSDITSAQLQGKKARIAVKFDSEQIHIVRDANGAITQGNPSDVDLIDDEWVFERDLTSSSPNWLIVET
jgi:predicted lipid-binding transport protein (Tim44 family)